MEALNLNGSVSSLVEENLLGGEMETEDLLLHRLSPYATLRPGDLALLLGIPRQTGDHASRKLASSLFLNNAIVIDEERSDDGERDNKELEERDLVVRGQDIGDLPAEYVVRGLRPHEMPVIGMFSASFLHFFCSSI